MKGKNWIDLDDGKIVPNNFFSELIIEFQSLKDKIESEEPEMVHLRMDVFSDYTIEQIKTKNYSELKHCFAFLESRIDGLNSELVNALNVSYCESLLLGDCSNEMIEIKKLMPPKLKDVYVRYVEYYTGLTKTE